MKRKHLLPILFSAGLVAAPPALACGAAGPSTHVGPVLAVAPQEGTFTILDAESQSPITFRASSEIIGEAKAATGSVMVDYEAKDGVLRATDVRY